MTRKADVTGAIPLAVAAKAGLAFSLCPYPRRKHRATGPVGMDDWQALSRGVEWHEERTMEGYTHGL